MDEIKQQLIQIVQDISSSPTVADARNHDLALKELGVDSLDTMLLFLTIQEKFGLSEIPEDEIKKLTTFNLIVSYTEKELKKKSSR